MTESIQNRERITCGEYLDSQRSRLAGIGDLSAPGAARKAEECLANIYAVSYQMNFERKEPPSPHRGPAEHEELDRKLVAEMSDGLRYKARAFEGILEDPGRLNQAMNCARKGNGFSLIEIVNTNFLARSSGKTAASHEAKQTEPVRHGPDLDSASAGPAL